MQIENNQSAQNDEFTTWGKMFANNYSPNNTKSQQSTVECLLPDAAEKAIEFPTLEWSDTVFRSNNI